MNKALAEELTQAVGQSTSGAWRTIAGLKALGVPKALGLTDEQWLKKYLGNYVQLAIAERYDALTAAKAAGLSNRQIAKAAGVNERTVRRNSRTGGHKPERKPRRGSMDAAKTPPQPLTEIAAVAITAEQAALGTRIERQAKREAVATEKQRQVELPGAKFRVVYADPPWSYSDKADAGSVQSGGAEQHYPSMSIAELCALPVRSICEPNAVLFMWTTSPMLAESFAVIDAWGFTYKASFVWDKHAHNMGHYNSVRHELLLVCTRGSCPPDAPKLFDSVQKSGRTEHSEKPNVFRIIIETLYSHGKRVELFAREQVDGWTAWGNEAAVASA